MSAVVNIISGIYNAIFRPQRLIRIRTVQRQGSPLEQIRQFWELVTIYLINLGLYAGPLTVAGFGRQQVPPQPEWFGNLVGGVGAPHVWEVGYAFIQNSLFLLTATLLTLITFHVSVVVSLQSEGFLRSAYAVIYSTSAYLAGIFTVVWYLSTNPRTTAAREAVIVIQKKFIYAVIDFYGADLGLPGGRPGSLDIGQFTPDGQWALAILGLLIGYYLYSMYLGARLNHEASRTASLLVVLAVMASPVLYVAGTVVAYSTPAIPTL